MARLHRRAIVLVAMMGLLVGLGPGVPAVAQTAQQQPAAPAKTEGAPALTPAQVDQLTAPIALYPDQLLFQILLCSTSPFQVSQLNDWLKKNPNLTGSVLQEAAQKQGFDPSYVALAGFPQVVSMMGEKLDWTRQLGQAFTSDRQGVFDSVQRLRAQAQQAGNLKSNEQQVVETQTTESGQQVIVVQPANPQIIYVPQYNPQVVYVQPAPTTVVVVHEDHSSTAATAAVAFTVGVIVGSASNPYYWGPYPYGWYGGAGYWYARAWDDYYDHREDMARDWYEHRENMAGERTERQENRQENRTDRTETHQENRTERQGQRQENQPRAETMPARSGGQPSTMEKRQPSTTETRNRPSTSPTTYESRGYSARGSQPTNLQSGTRSGAFSGYERGSASRASSARGRSSMSSASRTRTRRPH